MIDLFLSSDGKHTVHVSAQTPEEIVDLLPQAEAVYEAVVAKYGAKGQMANGNGSSSEVKTNGTEPTRNGKAPVCPVHGQPMVYREGRYGPFWSCRARMTNGAWCTVTKLRSDPARGSRWPSQAWIRRRLTPASTRWVA